MVMVGGENLRRDSTEEFFQRACKLDSLKFARIARSHAKGDAHAKAWR